MEKEELLISENQIAFDFENLTGDMEEEESAILPEGFVIAKNHEYIEREVLFVVVKERGFDTDLCGKTMLDWVNLAGGNCEKRTVEKGENLIASLRALNTEKPYIAVFYSNTPLLEKATFNKIIDYFCKNNMNVLALKKGYIFKTEFIKTHDEFTSGKNLSFDTKAFFEVNTASDLAVVSKYLYDKIRMFHVKNGVKIYGGDTVFIDADVEIESSAIIYPNNVLRGQSYVGNNVVLESGNFIRDSIIADGCNLTACYIDKSKVSDGSTLVQEKFVNCGE